jgi:hypothetical protein
MALDKELPEPTLTYWNGSMYTQRQLSGMVVKIAEYLMVRSASINRFIGDNPYADLRFPNALADMLDYLTKTNHLMDLLLLLDDGDEKKDQKKEQKDDTKGDKKDEEKDAEKKRHEEQEKLVDGWKDEFKKIYDKMIDKCKNSQKFDEGKGYWYWVKTFMIIGGVGYAGWLDQSKKLLEKVKDKDTREKLQKRLIDLGKKVIGEASKDNECRKIKTFKNWHDPDGDAPTLRGFGQRLKDAMDKDTGDGKEIEKVIEKIEGEVDKILN